MDKATQYILITNSTSLEGSTLTLAQNTRLLDEGISSEGKTIAEQLLNIGLKNAYDAAAKDAENHQIWSGYRINLLAEKALRSYGFDCSKVSSEEILHKICRDANDARMHAHTLGSDGMYAASLSIHNQVLLAGLWPKGNGLMARLLMNMLQMEFGLEPLSVKAPARYSKSLADPAGIPADVFAPALSCIPAEETVVPPVSIKSRIRILQLLLSHPRYTTADLAEALQISAKGVEKHLAKLKQSGSLLRIGPDKGGYWQVLKMY